MKEKIDWEAFKNNLKASIANEKVWAMGSTGEEYDMHMENIRSLEEQIENINNGDYDSVLHFYDEEVLIPFMK